MADLKTPVIPAAVAVIPARLWPESLTPSKRFFESNVRMTDWIPAYDMPE